MSARIWKKRRGKAARAREASAWLDAQPEWARSGSGITLHHMTPVWAAEAAEFNRALGWWLDRPELKYDSLPPPPPHPDPQE